MLLTWLGVVIIVLWVYILWGRRFVLARFPWIGEIEYKLFSSSRTILTGIGLKLGGLVIALHEFLVAQGYDETSIFTQVQDYIPEKYKPYAPILFGVLLILIGQAVNWLRNQTTVSLDEKV